MLDRKLGGIIEIYEKFVGDDPRATPMKIFQRRETPVRAAVPEAIP